MSRWLCVPIVALVLIVSSTVPVGAAPAGRYFSATGHWVQGPFLSFFDQLGGLDTFGYPRTEPFLSDGRLVQYFQRARMENWPENSPPFDVQLMLLGDAVMGPGDPPIPASQLTPTSDPSREYFPPTGHTLSGAFRDYFDARGGLVLFGYPTSEPYLGPNGFVIQRFQRARLERHPELPPGYQVSLGLLGDEYIFSLGLVSLSLTQPVSAVSPATLGLTPDSTAGKLVYQTQPGGDLVVSNLDGTGAGVVGQGLDPSWSPDGSQIASAVWGASPGIFVADADGSHRHAVYVGSVTRSPVWSPDGSQIAFYHRYNGWQFVNGRPTVADFFQVVVVRVASGANWIPYGQPNHSYSPSWAPDGQTLVFSGDYGLYLVSATQPARVIPNTSFQFTTPAWAPDGAQIAFTLRSHDHWDIGVIGPDGNGLMVLTANQLSPAPSVNNAAATWSPAGDRLAFLSDRSGSWNLYIMNRDGSSVAQTGVTRVTYTGSYDRVVAWKK